MTPVRHDLEKLSGIKERHSRDVPGLAQPRLVRVGWRVSRAPDLLHKAPALSLELCRVGRRVFLHQSAGTRQRDPHPNFAGHAGVARSSCSRGSAPPRGCCVSGAPRARGCLSPLPEDGEPRGDQIPRPPLGHPMSLAPNCLPWCSLVLPQGGCLGLLTRAQG